MGSPLHALIAFETLLFYVEENGIWFDSKECFCFCDIFIL